MTPTAFADHVRLIRDAKLSILDLHAMLEIHDVNAIQPHVLAERLAVHRTTITQITDRLESRGLIHRRSHGKDRRSHWLLLTVHGEDTLEIISGRMAPHPA